MNWSYFIIRPIFVRFMSDFRPIYVQFSSDFHPIIVRYLSNICQIFVRFSYDFRTIFVRIKNNLKRPPEVHVSCLQSTDYQRLTALFYPIWSTYSHTKSCLRIWQKSRISARYNINEKSLLLIFCKNCCVIIFAPKISHALEVPNK